MADDEPLNIFYYFFSNKINQSSDRSLGEGFVLHLVGWLFAGLIYVSNGYLYDWQKKAIEGELELELEETKKEQWYILFLTFKINNSKIFAVRGIFFIFVFGK